MSVTSVGQGNGALGQPSWANTTINEINACLEKGQWAKARMKIISMPGSAFCSGANNAFKVWEIPAAVVLTLGQVVGGKGSPYYNLRLQVKHIARALVSFFEGLSIVMAMPVLLAKPKLVRDLHRGLGLEWQPAVTPPHADSVTTSEPVVVKKPVERAASPTLSSSLSLATSEKFQKVAAAVKPIANNVLATGTQFIQRMRKDPQFATKVALSVAAFGVVGKWLLSGTTVVEPPLPPEPLYDQPIGPKNRPIFRKDINPNQPIFESQTIDLHQNASITFPPPAQHVLGFPPSQDNNGTLIVQSQAQQFDTILDQGKNVITAITPITSISKLVLTDVLGSGANNAEMLSQSFTTPDAEFNSSTNITNVLGQADVLEKPEEFGQVSPKTLYDNSTAVALRDEVIAGTCPIDGEAFEDAIREAAMREAAICQVYTILDPVSFPIFERMRPEKSSAVALREEVIAGTCPSFNGRDVEDFKPNALTSIPSGSLTSNVSSIVSESNLETNSTPIQPIVYPPENLDNWSWDTIKTIVAFTTIATMVVALKSACFKGKPSVPATNKRSGRLDMAKLVAQGVKVEDKALEDYKKESLDQLSNELGLSKNTTNKRTGKVNRYYNNQCDKQKVTAANMREKIPEIIADIKAKDKKGQFKN